MPSVHTLTRCPWCGDDPLYVSYHDHEWGLPLHDDRRLFELFILEGCQAGLSWITVLRKRENYRKAFDRFDPARVAGYGQPKIRELLANPGIIRNRLKIEAAIKNAHCFLDLTERVESFDTYVWDFVNGQPIQNRWRTLGDIPCETPVSDRMSRELRRLGFRFVGSTICYSFMQAAGLVNDHLVTCFRHREVKLSVTRPRLTGNAGPS